MSYKKDIISKLNEVKNELPSRIAKSSSDIVSAYNSTVSKMKGLPNIGDDEAEQLASAAISNAVKEEGVVVEVGAEKVHTGKFDRCIIDVKKKSPDVDAYAVCQASLGPSAIKKSHRRKPEDEYVRTNEVKDIRSIEDIEAGEEDYEEELKIKQDMEEANKNTPKISKKIALLKIKDELESFLHVYESNLSDDEMQRVIESLRGLVSIINLSESKIKITKAQLNTLIESKRKK
jgi:hypothetical protein